MNIEKCMVRLGSILNKWTRKVTIHYNKIDTKKEVFTQSTNKTGNRYDEDLGLSQSLCKLKN